MIYVMLLWLGGWQGGPATIQGFQSLQACQNAIPAVMETYKAVFSGWLNMPVSVKCIALKNAD